MSSSFADEETKVQRGHISLKVVEIVIGRNGNRNQVSQHLLRGIFSLYLTGAS